MIFAIKRYLSLVDSNLKSFLLWILPSTKSNWIPLTALVCWLAFRVLYYDKFQLCLYFLYLYFVHDFFLVNTDHLSTLDEEAQAKHKNDRWFRLLRATAISLLISMFDSLDVPADWPILVYYLLFATVLVTYRSGICGRTCTFICQESTYISDDDAGPSKSEEKDTEDSIV